MLLFMASICISCSAGVNSCHHKLVAAWSWQCGFLVHVSARSNIDARAQARVGPGFSGYATDYTNYHMDYMI